MITEAVQTRKFFQNISFQDKNFHKITVKISGTMPFAETSRIEKSTNQSYNQHVGRRMEIAGIMKTQPIA